MVELEEEDLAKAQKNLCTSDLTISLLNGLGVKRNSPQ
jgi:hypothetical protein